MNETSDQSVLRKEVAILVVIAALALVYFMTDGFANRGPDSTKVILKKIDASEIIGKGKLPKGFPADLPVELSNITESYVAAYVETGATAYGIRYKTSISPSVKYQEYLEYMTRAGYQFGEQGKNETNGVLLGRKNGDALSISITSEDGATFVQISLLDTD